MHGPRSVLTRIDRFGAFPAPVDASLDIPHAGKEVRFVVERIHHHGPPFPPLRVIAVVVDDKPLDRVIVRINSRHRLRVSHPCRLIS